MTVHRRFYSVLLSTLALSCATWADIAYTVTAAEGQRLKVEMRFDAKGPVRVQMPNWAPGAYVLSVPAKNLQDFAATDGGGKAVSFTKEGDNTWSIDQTPDRKVVVTYTVPFNFNGGAGNYSGPAVYLYVVDRKTESCTLSLNVAATWKIATGLDPKGDSGHDFTAPTYDVLADSPVTLGDIREFHYTVKGRDHLIALYGPAKDDVDEAKILKACKFVSEMENDFMRATPYKRYVWHFSVLDRLDGAGGLEHLNSTQIGLASGVGPRAVGVLAHEFFHLWNVKRIRSKPLGPFDYTQLPQTGALWWLEGVTDYYAHSLLHRYGWYDTEYFYKDILSNLRGVRANPARNEVSPYQSSFRVRDAADGRGNSDGYKVSYYNTGWLVGMCLDLEIRDKSGGKYSLDDVERALWDLCKDNKPGFEEDEIRKQCIKFGGPSLGDFYDRVVMQPGELPIERQLAKVGLKLVDAKTTTADMGVTLTPSKDDQALTVKSPHGKATDQLKDGDLVVSIDDRATTGKTTAALQKALNDIVVLLKPGETVRLKVKRGGQTIDVSYPLEALDATAPVIVETSDVTPEQLKLREAWMYAGRKQPS